MSMPARILQTNLASYVAALVYIAARVTSVPAAGVLMAAAMISFLVIRFERYKSASESKKKQLVALGVGYFVFLVLIMQIIPWFTLLAPERQVWPLRLVPYFDLFYIVPAVLFLIVSDRKKEPNQPPGPTPTSRGGSS